jgi:two-component system chemotaxis response regulator CheY
MGASVLVVDDDATMRTLLTAVFTSAGLEVLAAPSAEAALELLAARHVDAVLTDGHLPGLNGVELVAVLRGRPVFADVPMFLCTGSAGSSSLLVDAERVGVTKVLPKPMRPRELLDAVLPYLPESAPTP